MVRLVVEYEHVLEAHQLGHHALEHLAFGFERVQFFAASFQQRSSALGELHALAKFERVIIRDDDLRAVDVFEHVGRYELTRLIVAIRIVGLENPQPVLDRKTRRHDEKSAREPLALRVANRVDCLPSDDHRHDGRLAGAGREFQCDAQELGVCGDIRVVDPLENPLSRAPSCGATSVSQINVSTAST